MDLNTRQIIALIVWVISTITCLLYIRKELIKDPPSKGDEFPLLMFTFASIFPVTAIVGLVIIIIDLISKNLNIKTWDKVYFIKRKE